MGAAYHRRWVEIVIVAAACLLTGYWLGTRSAAPTDGGRSDPPTTPPAGAAQGTPTPALADAPEPDPAAEAARAEDVRGDAEGVRAECLRAAGGDWDRWQRETAPYRAALKARLDGLRTTGRPPIARDNRYAALAGRPPFPLFEVSARESLNYLFDDSAEALGTAARSMVGADRWLRQRGIDLLVLLVPKLTEVHVEQFIDPSPPDGILAPHARRTVSRLLESGVEVLDLFPQFRRERDPKPHYLFNTCDPHWAPRGMQVAADEVARRLQRYEFARHARAAGPLFDRESIPYGQDGCVWYQRSNGGWLALTREQQKLALAARTKEYVTPVRRDAGDIPVADDPASPVLLIGHSYAYTFRELLSGELNMYPRCHFSNYQTTEAFGDFLREPELLKGVRVVVWVTTMHHMTWFYPIPVPVLNAGNDASLNR